MNDYDPPSPDETLPARPVSSATSGPSAIGSSGDAGAAPPPPPATIARFVGLGDHGRPARRPRAGECCRTEEGDGSWPRR